MQSEVQLFNTAIARLGPEQVGSLISPQEDNVVGRICANIFPHVLDVTLSAHSWAFATRRSKPLSTPAILEEEVNPDYPYVFGLPKDCVKPIRLEGDDPAYVMEGGTIRCRSSRAVLVYVARITDPKVWPPMFADALAWAMAGELASAIVNDSQKQQMCYQHYIDAVARAVRADRGSQNPARELCPWSVARFNGGGF